MTTMQRRVYPRACGGTGLKAGYLCGLMGLSPRLRGNRRTEESVLDLDRSIPAPAGEPPCASVPSSISWVYPRACGGTLS